MIAIKLFCRKSDDNKNKIKYLEYKTGLQAKKILKLTKMV